MEEKELVFQSCKTEKTAQKWNKTQSPVRFQSPTLWHGFIFSWLNMYHKNGCKFSINVPWFTPHIFILITLPYVKRKFYITITLKLRFIIADPKISEIFLVKQANSPIAPSSLPTGNKIIYRIALTEFRK